MAETTTPAARAVIGRHGLESHPEGGWYRRVHTTAEHVDGRPVETAILYLLDAGGAGLWHRIDATEIWSHADGGPMEVRISPDGLVVASHLLDHSTEPIVVPAGAWQAARAPSGWSLVRCTVRPGFTFDGFELAPRGWEPG